LNKFAFLLAAIALLNASPSTAQAPPSAAQDNVQSVQRLPRPKIGKVKDPRFDIYGAQAKQLGLEGRVAVTFKLAADGKATLISIAAYDEPQLAYSARDLFPLLQFEPPPPKPAGESNEYVIGLVFCLKPSGVRSEFPREANVPEGSSIVIAGTRLSGAPVKTKPRDDVPAECK